MDVHTVCQILIHFLSFIFSRSQKQEMFTSSRHLVQSRSLLQRMTTTKPRLLFPATTHHVNVGPHRFGGSAMKLNDHLMLLPENHLHTASKPPGLKMNLQSQRQLLSFLMSSSSSQRQPATPEVVVSSNEQQIMTSGIYASKTKLELARAWLVFSLCQFPSVVKRSSMLINLMYRVLGTSLSNKILRMTFFGHFCAGEHLDDIRKVLQDLHGKGIGTILDFAAEKDVEVPRLLNGLSPTKVSARTFVYFDESTCDENLDVACQSVEDAATSVNGFAAIKCTALGNPALFVRMSDILVESRRLFAAFDIPNLKNRKRELLDHFVDYATFREGVKAAWGEEFHDEHACRTLFEQIDSSKDGKIDYLEWLSYMDPVTLSLGPLSPFLNVAPLSTSERKQLVNMNSRLERLAELAAKEGVRLMIDAEQTYLQPAIDHLVLNLQRKYNQRESVIFNTFQCYLRDSQDRLLVDLHRAEREGFRFACKLVRGAYMVQERKRAKDLGYADPIHVDIDATHRNYNALIYLLLQHNDHASFMVASHNEESVAKTVAWMKDLALPPKESGVFFGQLYGMCDQVSYALGKGGYQVYKYVPYGPVEQVVPYLVRRAEENLAMVEKAKDERKLVSSEFWTQFVSR